MSDNVSDSRVPYGANAVNWLRSEGLVAAAAVGAPRSHRSSPAPLPPHTKYKAVRAPNITAAVQLLQNNGRIKFLLVGSAASKALGRTRIADDVDVWLAKAEQIGICLEVLGLGTGIQVDGDVRIPIGKPPKTLHLLPAIDGVGFDEAYADRKTTSEGFPAISDRHNIISKRASGRAKDLADIRTIRKHLPNRRVIPHMETPPVA